MSSDGDKERYRYLDQFLLEYRTGDRAPNYERRLASKEDSDLFGRMLNAMERYEVVKGLHEDALKEPELTPDDAIKQAEMMATKEKEIGHIAAELLKQSSDAHGGISRIMPSFRFLGLLDMVNARKLILPSKDKLRELAECLEEKTDSLRQLNDAKQRIARLETMIRVLGRNPDEANSYTGDVQEGGESHE